MDEMQTAWHAWRAAHAAIDTACSALAAVPGAANQYAALCEAASAFQARGAILLVASQKAAKTL